MSSGSGSSSAQLGSTTGRKKNAFSGSSYTASATPRRRNASRRLSRLCSDASRAFGSFRIEPKAVTAGRLRYWRSSSKSLGRTKRDSGEWSERMNSSSTMHQVRREREPHFRR